MKLRIRGDSVRLRLGQSEVRRLLERSCVEEETALAPGVTFAYRLQLADGRSSASFAAGCITVRLSRASAERWAGPDEISVEFAQSAGEGRTLRVLVEKDFACLDAAATEPQDDAFPNPLASATSC